MSTSTPALQSFRLKNFKAVRDSGVIKFTPLTVLIGNNGSGKSSIVEGLEMLYIIATEDLDAAIAPWRDFRHILNKAVSHDLKDEPGQKMRPYFTNPLGFTIRSRLNNRIGVRYSLDVTDGPGGNNLFIKEETLNQKGRNIPSIDFIRSDSGRITGKYIVDEEETIDASLPDGISMLDLGTSQFPYDIPLRDFIRDWQFVSLVPQRMGEPMRQRRAVSRITLEKDGSNIAEYLQDIRDKSPETFNGIVSTLQLILPYSQCVPTMVAVPGYSPIKNTRADSLPTRYPEFGQCIHRLVCRCFRKVR